MILSSCKRQENKHNLNAIFVNKSQECWVVYNQLQSNYVFYRFNNDKTSDNLQRDENGDLKEFNVEGDLIIGPEEWNVTNDSILTWGAHKYDVINANENAIVLMYINHETDLPGYMFLIKEGKANMRKGVRYYEEKRLKNPLTYKSKY